MTNYYYLTRPSPASAERNGVERKRKYNSGTLTVVVAVQNLNFARIVVKQSKLHR